MDKFGVVLEEGDGKTKTGAVGTNCPKCGGQLEEEAYCDNCGVEPFAKKAPPTPPKK